MYCLIHTDKRDPIFVSFLKIALLWSPQRSITESCTLHVLASLSWDPKQMGRATCHWFALDRFHNKSMVFIHQSLIHTNPL